MSLEFLAMEQVVILPSFSKTKIRKKKKKTSGAVDMIQLI